MDGQMQQQLVQLVQAAMSGDQQATQQIQQIQQAAQQGDQQAVELMQAIQQVAQQIQGSSAPVSKNGSKLQYIQRLRGKCPEGYEMSFFKNGGKVCGKCMKVAKKASEGTKVSSDESDLIKEFKSKRCGGKIKSKK